MSNSRRNWTSELRRRTGGRWSSIESMIGVRGFGRVICPCFESVAAVSTGQVEIDVGLGSYGRGGVP